MYLTCQIRRNKKVFRAPNLPFECEHGKDENFFEHQPMLDILSIVSFVLSLHSNRGLAAVNAVLTGAVCRSSKR
jgi:hypothetical protein